MCERERQGYREKRKEEEEREEVVRKGRESGDGVTSYHNNQSNNSKICFFYTVYIGLYIDIVLKKCLYGLKCLCFK